MNLFICSARSSEIKGTSTNGNSRRQWGSLANETIPSVIWNQTLKMRYSKTQLERWIKDLGNPFQRHDMSYPSFMSFQLTMNLTLPLKPSPASLFLTMPAFCHSIGIIDSLESKAGINPLFFLGFDTQNLRSKFPCHAEARVESNDMAILSERGKS